MQDQENTRTKQEADKMGQMKKVTTIVTSGGVFPDEEWIVKTSRKVVNVFRKSPQCKDELDHARNAIDMPNIALQNYPETRVGYVVTTLLSLMANHCILSVSLHNGSNEDFEKVWKKLPKRDVAPIQQMEATTKLLFASAVDESQ